jgi:hypothetical protein
VPKLVLRLLAAIGLVVTILTGSVVAHLSLRLAVAPSRPVPTTVAAAPDEQWVVLDGVRLDCSTQTVRHGAGFVMATDGAGQHPFVAELAGTDRCKEVARLDGAFLGRFSRTFLRERQGIAIPPGKKLRVFSEGQSPPHLWHALGGWLPWLGGGLLLVLLGVRGLWRQGV